MERALVSWVAARGSNRVSEVDANLADSIYLEKKGRAVPFFDRNDARQKRAKVRCRFSETDFTTGAMSGGAWPRSKPIERRIGDFST